MFNRRLLLASRGLSILLVSLLIGCGPQQDDSKTSFVQIGDFTINKISPTRTEVRDGAGRTLVLVPRDAPAPDDVEPTRLIRTPVQRVVAYGLFDVATLRALGVMEDVLVGTTTPEARWHVDSVKQAMASGQVKYLGNANSIDMEKLREQQPELVLTWDYSVVPMLDELGIPSVVTTTPVAMCLNARMRFVQFLAPFFNKEAEADAFFNRVNNSLKAIRARTINAGPSPKVMWGDIYEKRVLVEPGNAWVGELVALAESDYLFEDVYGTSCIEISVERFLYSGQEADILFTYRTGNAGVTSKTELARINPLLEGIRPLTEGKVYAPLPHYSQSGDHLDEILTEISAILHPELYPDYPLQYFTELPATEPAAEEQSL